MGYIDDYINRVNRNGNSIANSVENSTKSLIVNTFKDSPFYRTISIKDSNAVITNNVDVRMIEDNTYNKRELLFHPDTAVNIGDLALFDNQEWLITDFAPRNGIFPKGQIERCHDTLTITTETQGTYLGTDNMGRPVYDTPSSSTKNYPCIVKTFTESYNEESSDRINVADGKIVLMIQYDSSIEWNPNIEFNLFGNTYKMYDFDYSRVFDGKGVLFVLADKVL